jgi:flavin-dependent dehydrogenase
VRRVDVLIAGGGPAGSTLAALAAGAGARVVLVERQAFPRDKVCGEFVSVEGRGVLERLGVLESLLEAGATTMDGIRLSTLGGRRLCAPLPDVPGVGREALGISRRVLDATLLERAVRAGAECLERVEAVSPVIEDGRVRGMRLRSVGSAGSEEETHAAVTVAADGRRSVLVRALHPSVGDPVRSGPRSWFGLKSHFEADPARLGRRVELHLFDGGYAGLGNVESGRVNVCVMATVRALRAHGGSPDRLLHERVLRNPAIAEVLARAGRSSPWKSIGPLRFGVRRAAAAGALFVGDAAGTIDPYSGEGIAHALRGAELAAGFVVRAAAEGALSPALGSNYAESWTKSFAPVTRRVRRLGRLLESWWIGEATGGLLAMAGGRLLPSLVAATRTGAAAVSHVE